MRRFPIELLPIAVPVILVGAMAFFVFTAIDTADKRRQAKRDARNQVIGVVEQSEINDGKITFTFTDGRKLYLNIDGNDPLKTPLVIPKGVPAAVIYNDYNRFIEALNLTPLAEDGQSEVEKSQRYNIEIFTERLDDDPKDYKTLCSRAGAYMVIRKYDLAIADYNAALKIRPDNPGFLVLKAIALKEKHQAEGLLPRKK